MDLNEPTCAQKTLYSKWSLLAQNEPKGVSLNELKRA